MADDVEKDEDEKSDSKSSGTVVLINPEARFNQDDDDDSADAAVKKSSPPAGVKIESLWLRFCR